jgi:carbon storage regulator
MLVLSRQRDETIMIGDDIEITVVDIRGDKVRLGITAPATIPVHRKEVYEAIQRENREAARVKMEDLPSLPKGKPAAVPPGLHRPHPPATRPGPVNPDTPPATPGNAPERKDPSPSVPPPPSSGPQASPATPPAAAPRGTPPGNAG